MPNPDELSLDGLKMKMKAPTTATATMARLIHNPRFDIVSETPGFFVIEDYKNYGFPGESATPGTSPSGVRRGKFSKTNTTHARLDKESKIIG
jgi:hypothetical protein